MINKIIEACKQVQKGYSPLDTENVKCDDFSCSECPFSKSNNNNINCGRDTQENYIKIAKEYIEKNLPPKKENEIEKSFREVIADIKEGETWESLGAKITKYSDSIQMLGFGHNTIFMDSSRIFNLQRKEYTFEEAFKAYEEDKEIESCQYRYKKIEGRDCWYCESDGFWDIESNGFNIDISEIRNKWYIND